MTKKLLNTFNGDIDNSPPIWLMRQAGRYLPEYKKTRELAGSFLDLCYNHKLATEVTLQPLKRFDLDAAILFADILLIPNALGLKLAFNEGIGPELQRVKNIDDINDLKVDKIHEVLHPVYEAVSAIRSKLENHITLIGFAGSPWTVSTYMVEGKGSKDHSKTKQFMVNNPNGFDELIRKIEEATIRYLLKQIEAGAEVIKLFDSWAGSLPASFLEKYSLNPMINIAKSIKQKHPHIPVIVFPKGVGPSYKIFAGQKYFDCLAIDSNLPLSWARQELQPNIIVQGNLDPSFLVSGGTNLVKEVKEIKETFTGKGHIFNLGHGITPDAKIENVDLLIKTLKNEIDFR